MYTEFYGFKEKPFEITPDPQFLFITDVYKELLSTLIYGIKERRGFIAMIGEVGSGKTLMLNTVQSWLDKNTRFASIFNSDLTFKQILLYALADLEVISENQNLTKAAAIQRLNNFALEQLKAGSNIVLFIDEAQNLSTRTLENIRMLGNLETPKQKLVQIVLAGQPEFEKKLARPECRQLAQRIGLKVNVDQLGEDDTYDYIRHRMKVAGLKGPLPFTEAALKTVWDYSQGSPRKINLLCENALLHGYGMNLNQIDESVVQEAAKEIIGYPITNPEVRSRNEKDIVSLQFESVPKSNRSRKTRTDLVTKVVFILVAIVVGILFFL